MRMKITLEKIDLIERRRQVEQILMRWCSLYQLERASHLCRVFDFASGDPATWKHRGVIPFEWLVAVVDDKKTMV